MDGIKKGKKLNSLENMMHKKSMIFNIKKIEIYIDIIQHVHISCNLNPYINSGLV